MTLMTHENADVRYRACRLGRSTNKAYRVLDVPLLRIVRYEFVELDLLLLLLEDVRSVFLVKSALARTCAKVTYRRNR